jgi:hypothetical protein
MRVTIEQASNSQVQFKQDPEGNDSHFDVYNNFLISFYTSLSDRNDSWQPAFIGEFKIASGVSLRTQRNRLFVSVENPRNEGVTIKKDNVHIHEEMDIFNEEIDRFMADYLDLFNEVMFEDSQLMPIPDYFRVQFTYLDGAMVAELNFKE